MALSTLFSVLVAAKDDAADAVQVGRYSTLAAVPTKAQRDPLRKRVQIAFPAAIQSVGDALQYVLRDSGYGLAPIYAADPATRFLLSKPLPAVHRQLGPMSLEAALTTLAGPVFRLVVDPLHRLLSFEVIEKYQALGREVDRYPNAPRNIGHTEARHP